MSSVLPSLMKRISSSIRGSLSNTFETESINRATVSDSLKTGTTNDNFTIVSGAILCVNSPYSLSVVVSDAVWVNPLIVPQSRSPFRFFLKVGHRIFYSAAGHIRHPPPSARGVFLFASVSGLPVVSPSMGGINVI